MDHPLKLRMERSQRTEYIFNFTMIWKNIWASSYGLNKLYFSHTDKAFILKLIYLGHHGAVETNKNISLWNQITCQTNSLNDWFKLSKTHEWFISWLNFKFWVLFVNFCEYCSKSFQKHVVLFTKIFL